MKIKGVIKNLKIKNIKKKLKNDKSKIYLGISLELLWAAWGQFSFRYFLVLVLVLKVYKPPPMLSQC